MWAAALRLLEYGVGGDHEADSTRVATTGTTAPSEAIFWGLVLILSIVVLGVFVWMVRRWAFRPADAEPEEAWSLQHLRELRAGGQITDSEFEVLKSKLLRDLRGPMERKDAPAGVSRKIDAEKR